jgi:predicted enzyme related to lactoylglutathione lyase
MANPFAHIELSTDDLAAAKAFYKKVFAWKLQTIPGMGYTMIDVGKGTGGGMTKKQMKEQPTAWLPYVEVSDVKETLAKAKKAGAQVVVDYTEIGEMGSIGVFVDPTGAGLGVWAAAKKPRKRK